MSRQLDGKTVIVTGAFGVLGRALSSVLKDRGARVAGLDLSACPSDLQAEENFLPIGGVNLTEESSAKDALASVAEKFQQIDCIVNVAGGFAWETFEQGSLDTWDVQYQMNLRTAVVATHSALPYLLSSGNARVVNVSALAALKAGLGVSAYAAAKAGVARFTESLAEELKHRNVTVNAVMPSIIDTPNNREAMADADFSNWVNPEALAGVISFLLSDEGSVITGACLPVPGRV
tara:strand:+ start:5676 stop:6377 length:702 start_codon:yes stop_codon:yes gene_type:complete